MQSWTPRQLGDAAMVPVEYTNGDYAIGSTLASGDSRNTNINQGHRTFNTMDEGAYKPSSWPRGPSKTLHLRSHYFRFHERILLLLSALILSLPPLLVSIQLAS